MKKIVRLIGLMFLICILGGCGEREQDIDAENDFQTSTEDYDFQPDYIEGEQNTKMLSKYVAGQGKWVYYFTPDAILKSNNSGESCIVYSVSNVRQICVLGDWIYYYTDNVLGKIRTDGTCAETIINGKLVLPFLIQDNLLYYIDEYNVSATSINYDLHCYDLEGRVEKMALSTQRGTGTENPVRILGVYQDEIYLLTEEPDEILIGYLDINTLEPKGEKEEDCLLMIEGLRGGFIYDNQLLYGADQGYSMGELTDLYVVNLDEKKLDFSTQFQFGYDKSQFLSMPLDFRLWDACNIDGEEYWIICIDNSKVYLVPASETRQKSPEQWTMKKIVEEDAFLRKISVVGDYLYYFCEGDNAEEHLYRIGLNGTDWSQMF